MDAVPVGAGRAKTGKAEKGSAAVLSTSSMGDAPAADCDKFISSRTVGSALLAGGVNTTFQSVSVIPGVTAVHPVGLNPVGRVSGGYHPLMSGVPVGSVRLTMGETTKSELFRL